jgi:hypothetical protein
MLINKWRKEYVRYFYRHLYEKYKWPQDVIMRRAGINAMVKGSDGEIVKLLEIYGIPTPCNQKKQSLESVTYGIQMNRLVGAQEKPGWIWYSKADYMIYCIPITGGMIFHRMKLADLRDWLADGRKHRRYPVENLKYGGEIRRICSEADGLVVPRAPTTRYPYGNLGETSSGKRKSLTSFRIDGTYPVTDL